jgi:hypothetical protein
MKSWRTIRRGDQLKPGSLIQTAEDGSVDVVLGDKISIPASAVTPVASTGPSNPSSVYKPDANPQANVVHIFPSTVLAVDKLSLERTSMDDVSETQLDLKAGQIMGNVKKLSGGSRYEVKIPNGVAGIRGTTYVIRADGKVFVLTGSVVISYVDNTGTLRTAVVTAGNEFITQPDGPGIIVPISAKDQERFPNPISVPITVPVHLPGGPPPIIIHISPN